MYDDDLVFWFLTLSFSLCFVPLRSAFPYGSPFLMPVNHLVLSTSNRHLEFLVYTQSHGICRIWNIAELKALSDSDDPAQHTANSVDDLSTCGDNNQVCSVAWSPDDQAVVSGSKSRVGATAGPAIIRDLAGRTGQVLHRLDQAAGSSSTPSSELFVAWSPSRNIVCSGSEDGYVRLWNTSSGSLIAENRGHQDAGDTCRILLRWSRRHYGILRWYHCEVEGASARCFAVTLKFWVARH